MLNQQNTNNQITDNPSLEQNIDSKQNNKLTYLGRFMSFINMAQHNFVTKIMSGEHKTFLFLLLFLNFFNIGCILRHDIISLSYCIYANPTNFIFAKNSITIIDQLIKYSGCMIINILFIILISALLNINYHNINKNNFLTLPILFIFQNLQLVFGLLILNILSFFYSLFQYLSVIYKVKTCQIIIISH